MEQRVRDWLEEKERRRTSNETPVKGLLCQILIMLLQVLFWRRHEFDGDELVATLLETGDDIADEAALHAVGLDGDETVG